MAKTKVNNHLELFKRVADIEVPEQFFHPIQTDSPELDSVFSELGGLIPSQVTLVTGNPGSGKTTLCAVVGSRLTANTKRPVVFLSYEMSDFQLKTQARKIPGFTDLLISTHEFHAQPEGISALFTALDAIGPCLVIADSLQKMASKMPQGPTRGQVVLVEEFTKWAKKSFTPVLLIGHNGKGGDYSGPSFLKHEVDSHLCVWYDKETHERLFSMSKNRFGGNMEQYPFRITPEGVFVGSEWWSRVDAQTPEDVRDTVLSFKSAAPNSKTASWAHFRDSASSLITYLNKKHADRFREQTWVGSPEKVQLAWDGRRFCCTIRAGKITLGRKFFDKITDSNFKSLGYRSEQPYIHEFISTKEEALIWAVIHEWVHLFKGYDKHTKKMWREISRIAREEIWLWSQPSDWARTGK
jgi:hypothetical protein